MISASPHLHWFDWVVIGSYLVMLIAIGLYLSRRIKSFEQYFVAGRVMTTPILICTLVSTYYGVDVLFGTSEVSYNEGIVAFFSYSMPTYFFFMIAAFAVAKRVRQTAFFSLPEIMGRHYGINAQVTAAMASFVYALPALGLLGLGRAASVILGWDPRVGALVAGGVALAYTLTGGLWAVAITDTIQFVLMATTLAVAVPIVMMKTGSFIWSVNNLDSSYFDPLGGIPIWLVLTYAATGLSILVEPGFYQRIFAAKSFKMVRNAMLIGLVVWGAYDWCVTAIGMLARNAVAHGYLSADIHPNEALLRAVVWALPAGFAGVFLAGVLASEMSTIDSYCLIAGGNIVYDIYRPVFKPDIKDRDLVRYTKWGVVVSWILGYFLAFVFERIMALWVFLSTVLTSTVFVPIMAALYWKWYKTRASGLLSSVAGLVVALTYYVMLSQIGSWSEEYGTYIWSFELMGAHVELWQEYALFFSLPASVLAFFIGNCIGEPYVPERLPERSGAAR
ncbi:MAG: sodium:solute symporter family protein [Acidobacteriota bacterium]